MQRYRVLGLMSGTSLDGLDLALCDFVLNNGKWEFDLTNATTISYSPEWTLLLRSLMDAQANGLREAHSSYGHFLGSMINQFCEKEQVKPDFVASHGHTIFHEPGKGITYQLGDGAAIASECKLPVVHDFRNLDVSLGGQGAPLVPIGDKRLFSEYSHCLNLGGIANISFDSTDGQRIAFDVCPANIVLNQLAQELGSPYDVDGKLARAGKIDSPLLSGLNSLQYYHSSYPKSLSQEWIFEYILPLLDVSSANLHDVLRTFTEHIAQQISNNLGKSNTGQVLVTGGGAHNQFLIERLRSLCQLPIVIPSADIIDFKEAIIFGFLGVLRWREEINCLCSATGARRDCSGGQIALP